MTARCGVRPGSSPATLCHHSHRAGTGPVPAGNRRHRRGPTYDRHCCAARPLVPEASAGRRRARRVPASADHRRADRVSKEVPAVIDQAMSETSLVLAAQQGDAAALGALLARHEAGMRAVAVQLLGYGGEADDAVQDAMLIALQRITDLRDPAAAGPWLRSIVRNAGRQYLRTTKPVTISDRQWWTACARTAAIRRNRSTGRRRATGCGRRSTRSRRVTGSSSCSATSAE